MKHKSLNMIWLVLIEIFLIFKVNSRGKKSSCSLESSFYFCQSSCTLIIRDGLWNLVVIHSFSPGYPVVKRAGFFCNSYILLLSFQFYLIQFSLKLPNSLVNSSSMPFLDLPIGFVYYYFFFLFSILLNFGSLVDYLQKNSL